MRTCPGFRHRNSKFQRKFNCCGTGLLCSDQDSRWERLDPEIVDENILVDELDNVESPSSLNYWTDRRSPPLLPGNKSPAPPMTFPYLTSRPPDQ